MNDEHVPVMSTKRARTILDTFGGNEGAWPDRERAAMLTLLRENEDLEQVWRETVELDRLLAASANEVPSGDLMSRLLDDAAQVQKSYVARWNANQSFAVDTGQTAWRQLFEFLWPYGSPTIPAGALAASIVLGVSVGALSVGTKNNVADNSAYEMVAYAVGDGVLGEDWQ